MTISSLLLHTPKILMSSSTLLSPFLHQILWQILLALLIISRIWPGLTSATSSTLFLVNTGFHQKYCHNLQLPFLLPLLPTQSQCSVWQFDPFITKIMWYSLLNILQCLPSCSHKSPTLHSGPQDSSQIISPAHKHSGVVSPHSPSHSLYWIHDGLLAIPWMH